MTDQRTYPPGVPCWIDTAQQDPGSARTFYGEVFGWTFDHAPGPGGSYWAASLDGRPVGGISSGTADSARWNTYVAVEDVGAAAALVGSAGGTVTEGPVDTGTPGTYVSCVDPTGAAIRLWQPGERLGVQITNAPNSWNFSDLQTNDPAAARAFYGSVFGWVADDLDLGGGAIATLWRRPGYGDHLEATVDPDIRARQAGFAPPGFEDAIAWLQPLESRSVGNWHVTFTVADRDTSVAAAERRGATTVSSEDTEWTRATTIRDPQGAELTLSQFLGG